VEPLEPIEPEPVNVNVLTSVQHEIESPSAPLPESVVDIHYEEEITKSESVSNTDAAEPQPEIHTGSHVTDAPAEEVSHFEEAAVQVQEDAVAKSSSPGPAEIVKPSEPSEPEPVNVDVVTSVQHEVESPSAPLPESVVDIHHKEEILEPVKEDSQVSEQEESNHLSSAPAVELESAQAEPAASVETQSKVSKSVLEQPETSPAKIETDNTPNTPGQANVEEVSTSRAEGAAVVDTSVKPNADEHKNRRGKFLQSVKSHCTII